jgi:hypothetical protein
MKNNLNEKNKSISKSKDNNKNIVLLNKKQINIIPSRSILKTNSKKKSKKSKQKRITSAKLIENIEFPQGEKYKCIGPCYPANTLYYHPLTLQAIKSKSNSCPINLQKVGNKNKIKDKCVLNENYDYESYDMFADLVQIATSDNVFLEQIYNIKDAYEGELFLANNIKQLPNLSQKRIINSLYKVYRKNDSFPSENFVNVVKSLIKNYYDVEIKSKKIIDKIMDNKHDKEWDDILENLVK